LDAHRMPLAKGDLTVVTAAHDPGRSALLLTAVHPVRVPSIGRDVIELRRRLIVPGAPRLAPVHGYNRALVPREQDDLGIARIDPKPMVVVTARSAAELGERRSAVRRLPGDDVRHI